MPHDTHRTLKPLAACGLFTGLRRQHLLACLLASRVGTSLHSCKNPRNQLAVLESDEYETFYGNRAAIGIRGDLMTGPDIRSRFNQIYDATHKAALTFITAKCGRTADISDIFQETYMELYQVLVRRGPNYITNEKAFVLRLAKQKLARHYSLQERLRLFVSAIAVTEDGEEVGLTGYEADLFLTEDFAVDKITLDEAKAYIFSRPEIVQKVFYLFYDVGLTIAETAAALGISESQVKNKLYRSLKELRKLLTR